MRRILHVDMDAFYASVEQRDNAELRGKPVAVGGTGPRSVVAAASYEAREYGVRSAMPARMALDLCPALILVHPRFDVYKAVSNEIRGLFHQVTPLVEPLSLDEAYLDISEQTLTWDGAIDIAQELKRQILITTELTASAGVAMNKFLAKMASDQQKPNGLTFISPDASISFLEQLPVKEFFGIGKATAEKMRLQGIETGKHLKALSEYELVRRFGKNGRYFYKVVRGLDERPVTPHRERKSLSVERTYSRDLNTPEEIDSALKILADLLIERIKRAGETGPTLTLKVRFDDFSTFTRQRKAEVDITNEAQVLGLSKVLLDQFDPPLRPIRLLGVGISGFEHGRQAQQLLLNLDK